MNTTKDIVRFTGNAAPIAYAMEHDIDFLYLSASNDLNLEWLYGHPDLLNYLLAGILRRPKNLTMHMQRIYYCYQKDLRDELYGAIVDLFTIMDRHRLDFCGRILSSVKSHLSDEQYTLLRRYLLKDDFPILYLPQNHHTLFGKGYIGGFRLVNKVQPQHKQAPKQDPLELANHCIEYSQLDEAKAILEEGILEDPDREELHDFLLYLYKSLKDAEGFRAMYAKLNEAGNLYQTQWDELNEHFHGL